MRIYHASNIVVSNPDTIHSRDYLDFGRGFYVTTIREQAVRYAQRFLRRGQNAWMNVYELDEEWSTWKVLRFETYDRKWLDYVAKCRAGEEVEYYDMVIGGIANDRVILTLDRYFSGELNQEEALGLLKFEKPNIQYCIRSEEMLKKCLTYIKSEEL